MGTINLTREWVAQRLPKRPIDANKGTFGKVLVIAGSQNYPGAAYLACAACYRVGAGLVTLVTDPEVKALLLRKLPEVTYLSLDEISERLLSYDVLLLGPGLGQSEESSKLIQKLLDKKLPKTVIDGDGLNILSKIDKWWNKLNGGVILTPHPGEMSRLTGKRISEIQNNREKIAKEFAEKWGKVVILKGANTIISSPGGEVTLSPFANPVLATAGTGDVLAGIIAGFSAQGLDIFNAACIGVYIHGFAGELLGKKMGDRGGLAGDLLSKIPMAVKELLHIPKQRIS